MKLKLITLNICSHTPWEEKSEKIINFINKERPDMLCVQEIARNLKTDTENHNQFHKLQDGIKMEGLGSLHTDYIKSGDLSYLSSKMGQATYWKKNLKVIDSGEIVIDRGVGAKLNSFVYIAVKVEECVLHIVNVHLSTVKEERFFDWMKVKEWVDNNVSKSDLIIAGDFNATVNAANDKNDIDSKVVSDGFINVWGQLREDKCVTYRSSEWWLKNYPKSREATSIIRKNMKFRDMGLDFVFYRGDLVFRSIETIDLTPFVSDHLGLICVFGA